MPRTGTSDEIWMRVLVRSCILPVSFLRRTDDKVQLLREFWRRKSDGFGPEVYDKHSAEAKRMVPKEQLLVYDVRGGWEPLCEFLEAPLPNDPFPRLNETQAMRATYSGMIMFGACVWMAYFGAAASLVYLALNPELPRGIAQTAMQ